MGRNSVKTIIAESVVLTFCAAVYLLIEWQGKWMQLCAAAFAGLLATIFVARVYNIAHLRYSFRIENPFDLKLPWRVVRDCLVLAWVSLRKLFGARVDGRVDKRELPETQLDTTTARAATITSISFAPNSYVIDAGEHSVMVHDLIRTGDKKRE